MRDEFIERYAVGSMRRNRGSDIDSEIDRFREKITPHKPKEDDVSGWISVDDRLPKKSGAYLLFDYGVETCFYHSKTKEWDIMYPGDTIPTHWMPLPEAPDTK